MDNTGDTIMIDGYGIKQRGFVIERDNVHVEIDGTYKRITYTTDRLFVPIVNGKYQEIEKMPFGHQCLCRMVLTEKTILGRIIEKDGADIFEEVIED